MKHFFILLLLVVFLATSALGENSAAPGTVKFPSLISIIRVNEPLDFCGEPANLDIPEVRERLEKELLLTIWDRPQVVLWIKRAPRFLPLIEHMLKENDLPDDLKYIAVAESALRPHVGSRKGAIGFWQFMESTGQKYGLQIDSEKDERRNLFTSTRAAIAYYKDLYEDLGSWTLAAAAYNMGKQGLQSEILAQKTNDFYKLYLPLETQRYIFRILSAKLILSNPQKYGFNYTQEDLYAPLEFDRIKIECFQETPIHIIARAADTYFKVIKDLNPEIRGHYIAAGSHTVLMPKGSSAGFQSRFKTLVDQWLVTKQERVYVVKEGDNLSTIAERFNVPLPALIIWNRLEKKKHIYPGDRLVIHSDEIGAGESDNQN
jgi:hypothetical protein